MGRRDFSAMLGSIDKTQPLEAAPDPDPQTTGGAGRDQVPAKEPKRQKRAPASRSKSADTQTAAAGGVGYDKLERKDTRLHERQITDLAAVARRINKQRGGAGHRITENTLIRLGIDLLLQRSDDLVGTTEAELAHALQIDHKT